MKSAPVVSAGGLSGSSAQEADTHRATDGAVIADDDLLDAIDTAIYESLDQDWLTSQGARAVVAAFKELGWTVSAHQAATPDGSGALVEALDKAVIFDAYNAADPLAIRLEFETEQDRLDAANAIDAALPAAPEGGLGSFSQAAKIPTEQTADSNSHNEGAAQ